MEKYTKEEKGSLLNALDISIYSLDRDRHKFADSSEFLPEIRKLKELRAKLILDIAPITLKELSPSNADYIRCCLCGNSDVLQYPEMRGIIEGPGNISNEFFQGVGEVCNKCFSEHNPDLYKIACEETQKLKKEVEEYYVKEYPDQFNADGTSKNVVTVETQDDSLPF